MDNSLILGVLFLKIGTECGSSKVLNYWNLLEADFLFAFNFGLHSGFVEGIHLLLGLDIYIRLFGNNYDILNYMT